MTTETEAALVIALRAWLKGEKGSINALKAIARKIVAEK
jgi:hypothetical protein